MLPVLGRNTQRTFDYFRLTWAISDPGGRVTFLLLQRLYVRRSSQTSLSRADPEVESSLHVVGFRSRAISRHDAPGYSSAIVGDCRDRPRTMRSPAPMFVALVLLATSVVQGVFGNSVVLRRLRVLRHGRLPTVLSFHKTKFDIRYYSYLQRRRAFMPPDNGPPVRGKLVAGGVLSSRARYQRLRVTHRVRESIVGVALLLLL